MKWYLVQQAIGEPKINVREEDEDLSLGFSLMRELAAQGPHANLTEIEPGVWFQSRTPGDPGR
jgi:hypothetical protein